MEKQLNNKQICTIMESFYAKALEGLKSGFDIKLFTSEWINSKNYELKIELLKKAIEQKKYLTEIEGYQELVDKDNIIIKF